MLSKGIGQDFGMTNPCSIDVTVSMEDIVRDLADPQSISIDTGSGVTGCPSGTITPGIKILLSQVSREGTTTKLTPISTYAQVLDSEKITSSVSDSANLGIYDVSFLVGLSTETDAELLTR